MNKLMVFAVVLLLLEVVSGTIFLMNFQELTECCGRSILSTFTATDEDITESGFSIISDETRNKIFYWIGIGYIIVIILIETPTLVSVSGNPN